MADVRLVKSIFLRAVEFPEGADRRACLDEVCGSDAALRREVERLLQAYHPDDVLLEPNTRVEAEAIAETVRLRTAGSTADQSAAGDLVDGRYQLLEVLGEGGMGTVWKAQQQNPVTRRVALKLIRSGMDSRLLLDRFDRERQALAVLDHPNIARVLDFGATDSGQPYFVMELVEGVPINLFCRQQQPNLSTRLNLLLDVCQAMHHAHQKGIIHRDLKPANILVAEQDGRFIARVIDFGLAKSLKHHIPPVEGTMQTAFGMIVGTPLYMAPERFSGDPSDADIRDDIYSLGVLLYELLTDTTPIAAARCSDLSLEELIHLIQQEEPPAPSVRLAAMQAGGRMTSPVDNRSTIRVNQIRGELDWITLKALDKDRRRRYASAGVMAEDIQRFLGGEPVSAAPPSRLYRLRKRIRKHRLAAASILVAVLALTGGVVASTTALFWALQQKQQAELAESRMHQELTRASEVKRLMARMLDGVRPQRALGADISLLKGILDTTVQDLNSGEIEDGVIRAEMHRIVGDVYQQLGLYSQAEDHLSESLSLSRDLLGADHPDTLASGSKLANVYWRQGRFEHAIDVYQKNYQVSCRVLGTEHEDSIGILNNIGAVYHGAGNYAEAEKYLLQCLDLRRRILGEGHTDTLSSLNNLATLYRIQSRFDESEQLHLQALSIKSQVLDRRHPSTLSTMNNLANLYADQRRNEEAEKLYSECLKLRREVLGDSHPDTLAAINNLAILYKDLGRLQEAESMYVSALEAKSSSLGADHPSTLQTMNNLAILYADDQRSEQAETLYLKTLDARRKVLGSDHPDTLATCNNLAVLYEKLRRWEQAETLYLESLDVKRRVLGQQHRDTLLTACNLGNLYRSMERYKDARAMYESVLNVSESAGSIPRQLRRRATEGLADACQRMGELDEAERLHRELLEEQLAPALLPDAAADQLNRAAWILLTYDFEHLRDPVRAQGLAEQACRIEEAATGSQLWMYLDTLALALHRNGDHARAVSTQQQALSLIPAEANTARHELERNLQMFEAALDNQPVQ